MYISLCSLAEAGIYSTDVQSLRLQQVRTVADPARLGIGRRRSRGRAANQKRSSGRYGKLSLSDLLHKQNAASYVESHVKLVPQARIAYLQLE